MQGDNEDYTINVKFLTGKTVSLTPVNATSTIDSVKSLLRDKEGIQPDQMRLLYGGKQLEGTETLRSCSIGENALLYLVLKSRGGIGHCWFDSVDIRSSDSCITHYNEPWDQSPIATVGDVVSVILPAQQDDNNSHISARTDEIADGTGEFLLMQRTDCGLESIPTAQRFEPHRRRVSFTISREFVRRSGLQPDGELTLVPGRRILNGEFWPEQAAVFSILISYQEE